MVTVSAVEVHLANAEQEQEQEQEVGASDNRTQEQEREQEQEQDATGEWIVIELSGSTTFDLLDIQGIEQYLGASDIASGKYTQVRLVVESVQVALGEGDLQDARLPSGELKINHLFDILPGEITEMVMDFEADKMVTVTGNGGIIVKPVIKLTTRQAKKPQGQGSQNPPSTPAGSAGLGISCGEFTASGHISRSMKVSAGDEITISLCSNASTGFQWKEQAQIGDGSIIEQTGHEFISPGGPGKNPTPGAAGNEQWTLRALKEGTTTLHFEYGQPWEGGQKAAWTLEVDITVQ